MRDLLPRLLLCLWPLRVSRIRETVNPLEYIGYLYVYVFGVPVAKIQLTNPWE